MEQFQEPEEKTKQTPPVQNAEVIPDKDMLTSEPVIDRSHAATSSSGPTVGEWVPPPLQEGAQQGQEQQPEKPDPTSHEFANEDLKDLPESEKMEAATHLAEGAFAIADEVVKEVGNQFLPIKQKKLRKLEAAGEINLDIEIHYSDGTKANAADAVDRFNDQATNALSLSEEYKKAGIPIIAKELAKKGVGLTPMQYFLFVLTPIELKRLTQLGMEIRSTGNEIIEAMKNMTAYPASRPVYSRSQQQAAPPPPVQSDHGQSDVGNNTQQQTDTEYHEPEEIPHTQPLYSPGGETIIMETPGNVSSLEDIQAQRGGGIIVDEFISPHLRPQKPYTKPTRTPGGKRNKSKRKTTVKKSAI